MPEGTMLPRFHDAVVVEESGPRTLDDESEELQILDADGRACSLHLAAAKDNASAITQLLKTGWLRG